MLAVGTDFQNMFKQNERGIALKITVTGTETRTYTNSEIVDFEIISNAMSMDAFTIGNVIANEITFNLRVPLSVVEDNAVIQVDLGVDLDGTVEDFSTWDQTNLWEDGTVVYTRFGTYYITDISEVNNNTISITALDKSVFLHRDYESLLTYPATMRDVASEIESMSGITLDSNFLTTIPSDYYVQLMPTTETYQSILGHIAGACGGNVRMTQDAELHLHLLSSSNPSVDSIDLGQYFSLTSLGDTVTITAVRLYESDDYTEGEYNETILGSGDDRDTLDIYNPFVDETIHQDLYDRFNGFTYRPASVDYIGYPYLEAGDKITLEKDINLNWEDAFVAWQLADFNWGASSEDIYLWLFEQTIRIYGGMRAEFKSPAVSEQYASSSVAGTLSNYIRKVDETTVKESVAYNGVTTSRAEGVVVERSDGLAKAVLNATEGLSLYSDTGSGLEKNLYAGVDGYLYANKMKIGGGSTVDGLGDVAYLDTLTSTYIEDGAIITGKIASGAVVANSIASNAVTATKIDVSELSAITADLGAVNAGTMNGVVFYTASGTADRIAIGETSATQAIQWQENGATVTAQIAGDAGTGQIAILADDDVDINGFDIRIDADDDIEITANDNINIYATDILGLLAGDYINVGSDLIPSGSQNLGTSSDRWASLNVDGTGYFGGSLFGADVYSDVITTRAVFVRSDGKLGTASSTRRVKDDIEPYEFDYDALMKLPVVTFRYKKEITDDQSLQYGAIAEDAEDLGLEEFVGRGEDGRVDYFAYERLQVANLQLIQKQDKMIKALEARIAELESKLE